MYYNYGNDIETQYHFFDNVRLAIKKVLKIYPLHCLTLAASIPIYFSMARLDTVRHIVIWIFKLISNIVLMQSWVPKSEFYWSFNAVSWYLSLQLAMYFAFPYIRKMINRNTNKKRIVYLSSSVFNLYYCIRKRNGVKVYFFFNNIGRIRKY